MPFNKREMLSKSVKMLKDCYSKFKASVVLMQETLLTESLLQSKKAVKLHFAFKK
jgi:hypothetical protein